jgi:hypothetical protein
MPQVALKDIEQALRQEFGSFGLDRVELVAGRDHDGDAALFVTAVLPLKSPLMPGEMSGAASVAIAKLMEGAGDDRLSYLSIRRPDDERPLEEAADLASPS